MPDLKRKKRPGVLLCLALRPPSLGAPPSAVTSCNKGLCKSTPPAWAPGRGWGWSMPVGPPRPAHPECCGPSWYHGHQWRPSHTGCTSPGPASVGSVRPGPPQSQSVSVVGRWCQNLGPPGVTLREKQRCLPGSRRLPQALLCLPGARHPLAAHTWLPCPTPAPHWSPGEAGGQDLRGSPAQAHSLVPVSCSLGRPPRPGPRSAHTTPQWSLGAGSLAQLA